MKRVLVTGFAPFAGQTINPSSLVLIELEKAFIDSDIELITQQLPVEQHSSVKQIQALIELHQPDIAIALGQAAGRPDISIERIAINIDDYPIKDNAGNQPIDEVVIEGGENAYFSSLPIKAMVQAIRAENLPASISNSAGTYVCNHLFYGLMHYTVGKKIQAGLSIFH